MERHNSLLTRIRKGDPLMMILIINLLVFVVLQLHLLKLYVSGEIAVLPWGEDLTLAANSSLEVMMKRPWSLITHLFAHIQPGHFLFNMVALYSMGKLFTTMAASRKLWLIYFLGGISGYVLFMLSFSGSSILNAGRDHSILGASAAAMAIVTATAIIQPTRIVYLFNAVRLELAWLAVLLVVLDLASIRSGINSGGHIGHLGGALFGLLYGIASRLGITSMRDLFSYLKKIMKRNTMKAVHVQPRPKTDDQFNTERAEKQKRIDDILDKIGRSGYESLSQAEKDFLFKHSQK